MGLHLLEIYRSPNIGVFVKTNDKIVLVPKGLAETKTKKITDALKVEARHVSVGGSRLLGPLVSMNNNGVLVSRIIEDYELKEIASGTGLNVERFESKFTAVGNLVIGNDRGTIMSPILSPEDIKQVRDVLGTEVEVMAIQRFVQVGSMIVATNRGAAVNPNLNEEETERVGRALGVDAYPSSVNGGVPYVSSGLVANSMNAITGDLTTGPELIFMTRALKV
jgi:translation initiation factor 6